MVEECLDEVIDDIVGIYESDDLNKLLFNEIMFLVYLELEVVFYKYLVDKWLMNYCMQGKLCILCKVCVYCFDNKQVDIEKGLFIFCIDVLGFMSGFFEQCVKVMVYVLM